MEEKIPQKPLYINIFTYILLYLPFLNIQNFRTNLKYISKFVILLHKKYKSSLFNH